MRDNMTLLKRMSDAIHKERRLPVITNPIKRRQVSLIPVFIRVSNNL